MKTVAIPHWQDRVSPVFDVAGQILIVEIEAGKILGRREIQVEDEDPQRRASTLARTGADTLICGAISRPLELALVAMGVEVIPQTCGNVEHVLAAFAEGRLTEGRFRMPGCCGRRQRHRARHGQDGW